MQDIYFHWVFGEYIEQSFKFYQLSLEIQFFYNLMWEWPTVIKLKLLWDKKVEKKITNFWKQMLKILIYLVTMMAYK